PRRSLRAPVAVGEVAITRAMDRLHRRDHAESAEASEVLLAYELDVFEALAQRRRCHPGRRDRIERDAHGAIADRMDRHCQTRGGRARDVGPKPDRIEGEDAAIVGPLVWLLERRGLRPERAVTEEFHVAELQPFVALACAHASRERSLEVESGAVADLWRGPRGRERQRERAMRYP